jgi:pimeloyl-ACP methyl ester carboxylesterase
VARPFPHVAGVEHRFVDAGGLRTHVAEAGEGEPIVMLHGWPQHWYEWRELIGPLAERYRVICPDLRGLGWTEAPPTGYEKEQLATDVLALLDELGLERVRLVGHDWGGWVGYLLCLRAPERVERYVALNILPPLIAPSARSLLGLWRLWYQWVIAAPWLGQWLVRQLGLGNPVLRWVGGGGEVWSEEEREAFLGQLREPARARASAQYYRTFQLRELPRLPYRYRGARLRTPTRILFGTGDRVQQAGLLEGIERRGEDLAYELFPGVGHFIADERPDLVLDRALSFFSAP